MWLAVLEKNLEVVDFYLSHVTEPVVYTIEVYETVARLGLNESAIFSDDRISFKEIDNWLETMDEIKSEVVKGASEDELRIFNGILVYLNNLHRPLRVSTFCWRCCRDEYDIY